ncbi:MAG: GH3 auxin-responsive promoter family protein [Elainellaceae cyanobacterium]
MRPIIQGFGYLLSSRVQRFHRALDHPQKAQQAVQSKLCDRLRATAYGQAHGIESPQDWQRLPIVDYDNLQPWIADQIRNPQSSILTPEPILFCEKTSGSRGAAKQIPYTRSLRQSFSHLFCIWAHDLIRYGPSFSTGKVYFCVSPKLAELHDSPSSDSSAAPALQSLQDDSEYLDPWLQRLLSPFLVSLPQLERLRTADEFKFALAFKLLSEPRLEIISVWSPSFLTVLLDFIEIHRENLDQHLGDRLSSSRRSALAASPPVWTDLWPHLKLISCWDSARAADSAETVRSLFPTVLVQGKGLLATEAPITVPLVAAQGQVPLLDEVFFEFEADDGTLYQLHELALGAEYSVILSQTGGLYRYRMGDRVRVTRRYRQTPCLEFLGRTHAVSDLVGEKLHEDFVAEALQQLKRCGGLEQTRFMSLVPTLEPRPGYVLLLDHAEGKPGAIATALDSALSQAHHYNHARLLGQLAPAKVIATPQIIERLSQHRIQNGQVWGDLKYGCLETRPLSASLLEKCAEIESHG